MDLPAPVASGINTPNPLQSMNQFMDLAKSRQQLQIGKSVMTEQASKAAFAKQSQQEMQSALPLLKDPVGAGIMDDDGNVKDGAQKVLANAMPTTWKSHYDDFINAAKTKVETKKAVLGLGADVRSQIASQLGGVITNPRADTQDVNNALDNVESFYKGTPNEELVNKITGNLRNHNPQTVTGFVRSTLTPEGLTGAGGLMTPSLPSNAAGQPIQQSRLTGAVAPVQGATYPQGLTPSTPQVAGATTREVSTGNADIDRANEVGNLQQVSAAALPLTQRIDQLSHEINSGHLAKMISESGNYLGFSSVNEARSQLNKDLGQVKGLAVARAGSDSRAATILEGYPTDTTPEATTHAAMDYIRGTARQNLARGKVLSQYQQKDPTGMRGFQAADNVIGANTDPLMHEYLSLKPAEQAGFFKRNFSTAKQAQDFRHQVDALKAHTRFFE